MLHKYAYKYRVQQSELCGGRQPSLGRSGDELLDLEDRLRQWHRSRTKRMIQPHKHNISNQRNTHKVEQAAEVAGLEPFDVPDVVRLDNTKQVLRVQLQHFDMKSKENVRSGARAHTIHALDEKR